MDLWAFFILTTTKLFAKIKNKQQMAFVADETVLSNNAENKIIHDYTIW